MKQTHQATWSIHTKVINNLHWVKGWNIFPLFTLNSTVHAQLSTCFVKKTLQCLAGHLSEDQIDYVVNKTALFLKKTGSAQWYCSNKPTNMSSLDPDLRQHLPCSDNLFSEGHKCTKDFREIFNTKRNDLRLCRWVLCIRTLMFHMCGRDTPCVIQCCIALPKLEIIWFEQKAAV